MGEGLENLQSGNTSTASDPPTTNPVSESLSSEGTTPTVLLTNRVTSDSVSAAGPTSGLSVTSDSVSAAGPTSGLSTSDSTSGNHVLSDVEPSSTSASTRYLSAYLDDA